MNHGVIRRQSGAALASPANFLGDDAIARRQGKVHRLTGGARRAVQAHGVSSGRCQIIAERRMVCLGGAQLALAGKRQRRQVAQILRRFSAIPQIPVEWRVCGHVFALILPGGLDIGIKHISRQEFRPFDGIHAAARGRSVHGSRLRFQIRLSVSTTFSRSRETACMLGSSDSSRPARYWSVMPPSA